MLVKDTWRYVMNVAESYHGQNTDGLSVGILEATPNESSTNEDAHIGYFVCIARNPCFLDCEGYQ